MVDTDDPQATDRYKFALRWLRHLMEGIPERVEDLYRAKEAVESGAVEQLDPESGGSPWMESDGGPEEAGNVD